MPADDEQDRPGSPDTGLIVRVWREPHDPRRVRARVLSFHGLDEPRTRTIATDEQDLVDAISTWVRDQLGPATPERPPR